MACRMRGHRNQNKGVYSLLLSGALLCEYILCHLLLSIERSFRVNTFILTLIQRYEDKLARTRLSPSNARIKLFNEGDARSLDKRSFRKAGSKLYIIMVECCALQLELIAEVDIVGVKRLDSFSTSESIDQEVSDSTRVSCSTAHSGAQINNSELESRLNLSPLY